MDEKWRIIPEYADYEVSDMGKVRSWKNVDFINPDPLILKEHREKNGYSRVVLRKDSKNHTTLVGHIVLLAFRGLRPMGFQMSHLDGNRANNKLDNLIWESRVDNERRKIKHGTKLFGEKHPSHKLNARQVVRIKKLLQIGISEPKIANKFHVSRGCISHISIGDNWRCLGEKAVGK